MNGERSFTPAQLAWLQQAQLRVWARLGAPRPDDEQNGVGHPTDAVPQNQETPRVAHTDHPRPEV